MSCHTVHTPAWITVQLRSRGLLPFRFSPSIQYPKQRQEDIERIQVERQRSRYILVCRIAPDNVGSVVQHKPSEKQQRRRCQRKPESQRADEDVDNPGGDQHHQSDGNPTAQKTEISLRDKHVSRQPAKNRNRQHSRLQDRCGVGLAYHVKQRRDDHSRQSGEAKQRREIDSGHVTNCLRAHHSADHHDENDEWMLNGRHHQRRIGEPHQYASNCEQYSGKEQPIDLSNESNALLDARLARGERLDVADTLRLPRFRLVIVLVRIEVTHDSLLMVILLRKTYVLSL